MSRDNKVTMPTSGAGITRYFDDSRSKIQFKPEHIIILAAIILIVIILLHMYGNKLLGIA
ncbi:preprotein translocase subunit Sec61beta [Candidatus Woesearchaeota archaeon CG10_big_fil_rev_8_21_14_0_10_34_8]|nr:MAG: preprotein translocase subunit Sec61beta [Candidatus Woesearchaeota archaeon CG10_big_fil_rev_8_21_14_0_10_34_8]